MEFTRNRLRHEAIPLLSRILGRDVRASIARAAGVLREDEAWLSRLACGIPLRERMRAGDIAGLPVALQRRVLLRWLRWRGIADVGFREVEAVRSILPREAGVAKVNLPGGRHARRSRGMLSIVGRGVD